LEVKDTFGAPVPVGVAGFGVEAVVPAVGFVGLEVTGVVGLFTVPFGGLTGLGVPGLEDNPGLVGFVFAGRLLNKFTRSIR